MARSPLAAIKLPRPFFQSHPSHTELVNSYLRTWVETGVKAGAFIHDADVYGSDPADLLRQFAPVVAHNGERAWYFYSLLRHKHSSGKRKKRSTGSGSWHSEARPKPVYMASKWNCHQIGLRQTFSFVVRTETGALFRTGWLMMEHRLLNDDAEEKPEEEEGFLVYRVLCKVYRSPRNPEPSGSEATLYENDDGDDSSNASPPAASGRKRKSDDVEPSEAMVAALSRHGKANDVIAAGAVAAPGRKEKAEIAEDPAETYAAAPPPKRKELHDENPGVAAPAPKKKSDGSSSPVALSSTTEMQCRVCGNHVLLALNRAEPRSQTEIAKDESAPGARQRGEIRFYEFL